MVNFRIRNLDKYQNIKHFDKISHLLWIVQVSEISPLTVMVLAQKWSCFSVEKYSNNLMIENSNLKPNQDLDNRQNRGEYSYVG